MQLTLNQVAYRAYLRSPVWKSKRLEALEFYGCICARCGEWGNDVHHATYVRVGGQELMEDLEVLCRDCHKAHHAVEQHTGRKTRGAIHREAIFRYLSDVQKQKIIQRFDLNTLGSLYHILIFGELFYAYVAARMLGYQRVYEPRFRPQIINGRQHKWDPKAHGVFQLYHKSVHHRSCGTY
jgi:hypothetical protein